MSLQEELKKSGFNKIPRGGPANPNDPYPVDEMIEQIQKSQGSCEVREIQVETPCPECIEPVIREVIGFSQKVEERCAAVESLLAVVARYLFRTASRMQINCVYYGGQDEISKYDSIRCLDDKRVEDELVTLDQCLTCTRYEPIHGRVYEIIDSAGLNAQQFMDDWQMAYLTQEEYTMFSCVNKMNEGRPFADCLDDLL